MSVGLNEQSNITAWQLFRIAEALTRAKKLEKYREEFYEELYECISWPTVNYDKIGNPKMISSATDDQAIRIIEAKERYDSEVQKAYDKDVRWQRFLMLASEEDRLIMIRYFKKKKYVKPETISALLNRINGQVEEEERKIEIERDSKVRHEYEKYWKPHERKKITNNAKHVFLNNKWIEIDPEENAHREWQEKADARQKELRMKIYS